MYAALPSSRYVLRYDKPVTFKHVNRQPAWISCEEFKLDGHVLKDKVKYKKIKSQPSSRIQFYKSFKP